MRFGLLISDIAAFLTGLVGLFLVLNLTTTGIFHLTLSNMRPALTFLGAGILSFAVMLGFLLPGLHAWTLRFFRPWRRRQFFFLLSLVWLIGVLFSVYATHQSGRAFFMIHMNTEMTVMGLAGFIVLFLLVFVVPGIAFREVAPPEYIGDIPYYEPPPTYDPGRRQRQDSAFGFVSCGLLLLWVVCLVGGAGYAMLEARFIPATEHSLWVAENRMTFIGIAALLLAMILLLAGVRSGRGFNPPNLLTKSFLFLLLAGVSIFAPSLASNAVPALESLVFEKSAATQTVIIDTLGQEMRLLGCNGTAYVSWFDAPEKSHLLCDIPSEIWQDLRAGDTLTLSGIKSQFGFRYMEISR